MMLLLSCCAALSVPVQAAPVQFAVQPNSLSSFLLHPNGYLYSWGWNMFGQLSLGDTQFCDLPVRVNFPAGEGGWTMVRPGMVHTLAIGNTGRLYAWGHHRFGELGLGPPLTNRPNATQVAFPAGVSAWLDAAASSWHSMALGNNGQLYSWGYNLYGVLGYGTINSTQAVPAQVPLPDGVASWTRVIAGDNHSLAIANTGQLFGWGQNQNGQLGNGSKTNQPTPKASPFPSGVTAWTGLTAGRLHTLALGNDGDLYAWGNNTAGQLGQGSPSPTNIAVPLLVPKPAGVSSWASLASGTLHSLALTGNGQLYAWGENRAGQLGFGHTNNLGTPTLVPTPSGASGWSQVTGGNGYTMGIASNGKLYAWGYAYYGGLGVGFVDHQFNPIEVRGFTDLHLPAPQTQVVMYDSYFAPDNVFETRISCPDPKSCRLESKTSINGIWLNRGSFTIPRGVLRASDFFTTNVPVQFYRVRVL